MNRVVKLLAIIFLGILVAACASRQGPPAGITDANALGGHVKMKGLNADYSVLESDVGPHSGVLATRSFYFPFDSSQVSAKDIPIVKAHGRYLMNHPSAQVLVEGNTDIRGSREYNLVLGQRRANAVANILRMQGVAADQVRTVSYGAEKPVALGHTESAYRLNRRTDILYTSR